MMGARTTAYEYAEVVNKDSVKKLHIHSRGFLEPHCHK